MGHDMTVATIYARIAGISGFLVSAACLGSALGSAPAFAELSKEAAQERCRETVGRPFVQTCMGGNQAMREPCREKVHAQVKACIMAALNAANGRANVAVGVPTEATPKLSAVNALPAGFVAPPRTITDITAILDNEKPDAKMLAELKDDADAQPEKGSSGDAQFYFDRANARAQLGRLKDSIADASKAEERSASDTNMQGRVQQLLASQYSAAGDPKKAFDVFRRQLAFANTPGSKGYQFLANRQIAGIMIQMGDIPQAEAYLRRSDAPIREARTSGLPGWRRSYGIYGQNWEAEIEIGRAMLFEARGQFAQAEASYKLAEQRKRAAIRPVLDGADNPPAETLMLQEADATVLSQARMKAKQGRLAEAEADARRALLARLKDGGKYNPVTGKFVLGLADVMVEEGRYEDAEKLARVAVEINQTVGIAPDSLTVVQTLSELGGILTLQRKSQDAVAVYQQIDKAIANWEPQRRQAFEINGSRIQALYASGQIEQGLAAAEELVKKSSAKVGDAHFDTASARGDTRDRPDVGRPRCRRDP